MTEREFINNVDSCGDLFSAFVMGLSPRDLDDGRLKDIVSDAYDVFDPWRVAWDDFYDYVETCAFEECM